MKRPRLTQESHGTTYLRPAAMPLIVAAIAVPVVAAMLLGVVTIEGTALGLAAGAAAVAALLVIAARARPGGTMEVAAHQDAERRLLVLATGEVTPEAAEAIRLRGEGAADVRLVVPVQGRRIDRWLSATDDARDAAQTLLAHSAGTLVAAGLPVGGSLGDSDPLQALEDELRSYPADEVVWVIGGGEPEPTERDRERLGLPLTLLRAS
ncbi:MAG: hypothetical protein ACXWFN_00910 [Solirubrobacterales bacterium]